MTDSGVVLKRAGRAAVSALSLAVLAGTFGVAGCGPVHNEFDPREFQRLEHDNVNTAPVPPKRALPPEVLEPAHKEESGIRTLGGPIGTIVRMPLREVIQRAVANNSDVKVAGYDPGVDEARVTEAEARFDPTVFANVKYDTQFSVTPNQTPQFTSIPVDPFNPQSFRTLQGEAGVRKLLESGGQASASYRVSRIQRSFGTGQNPPTVDPYYTVDLLLSVTQPLLRDFGTDVNRARIDIARNNQKVSLLEFRKTLEELLSDAERTYWQLVQAQREVAYQQALLTRTIDTYNVLYERFVQGVDVSRIQVSLARQSVESRRAVLVRARARVGDLSDQLKRLMNDPEFPISGPQVLLPAHGALVEPIDFDLQDQIDTAFENRFELAEQLARIDSARITERVAKNNELPQLNLQAQVDIQGVGNDFTGDSSATASQDDGDFINSTFGLDFEIPIGNRAALSITRRTKLQRLQAVEQYRNLLSQVSVDVTTAWREINTTWNEIVDRRRARLAAEDALGAILERRRAGEPLTPTFVQLELDTQQQLTNAQAEEAGAISNYNIAISRLERAKGTLLRFNNVVMDEEPRKKGQ